MKCAKCGSEETRKYGRKIVAAGTFQQYQCKNCGKLFWDKSINLRDFKQCHSQT